MLDWLCIDLFYMEEVPIQTKQQRGESYAVVLGLEPAQGQRRRCSSTSANLGKGTALQGFHSPEKQPGRQGASCGLFQTSWVAKAAPMLDFSFTEQARRAVPSRALLALLPVQAAALERLLCWANQLDNRNSSSALVNYFLLTSVPFHWYVPSITSTARLSLWNYTAVAEHADEKWLSIEIKVLVRDRQWWESFPVLGTLTFWGPATKPTSRHTAVLSAMTFWTGFLWPSHFSFRKVWPVALPSDVLLVYQSLSLTSRGSPTAEDNILLYT